MSDAARIKAKNYTDSDVLAFYMRHREDRISPFLREVGDFIAHPIRKIGVTLEATAYAFAQAAFFQRYQMNARAHLDHQGKCYWWLKCWFLGKIEDANAKTLRTTSGLTKAEAKKEVESWFPKKPPFPTEIACNNNKSFAAMANLFCGIIRVNRVFTRDQVAVELRRAFLRDGIPAEELPHFLVATAILLNGKSIEIVPGFVVNVELKVKERYIPLDDIAVPEDATYKLVKERLKNLPIFVVIW